MTADIDPLPEAEPTTGDAELPGLVLVIGLLLVLMTLALVVG